MPVNSESKYRQILIANPATGNFVDVITEDGITSLAVVGVQVPPRSYINNHIGQQVDTVIITPATGKRLKIYGVQVDSNVTNACCASFNFVSSVGQLVWRAFFDKAKAVPSWMPINITGGIDESLVLNTLAFGASDELFISVAYSEVD